MALKPLMQVFPGHPVYDCVYGKRLYGTQYIIVRGWVCVLTMRHLTLQQAKDKLCQQAW